MFGDDWTPAHLTGGPTNLYKEIALALKGVEWRKPGLVAFASKLVASAAEHQPIDFKVPDTYEPASGKKAALLLPQSEPLPIIASSVGVREVEYAPPAAPDPSLNA